MQGIKAGAHVLIAFPSDDSVITTDVIWTCMLTDECIYHGFRVRLSLVSDNLEWLFLHSLSPAV